MKEQRVEPIENVAPVCQRRRDGQRLVENASSQRA
jgi:hypothetical protein